MLNNSTSVHNMCSAFFLVCRQFAFDVDSRQTVSSWLEKEFL